MPIIPEFRNSMTSVATDFFQKYSLVIKHAENSPIYFDDVPMKKPPLSSGSFQPRWRRFMAEAEGTKMPLKPWLLAAIHSSSLWSFE